MTDRSALDRWLDESEQVLIDYDGIDGMRCRPADENKVAESYGPVRLYGTFPGPASIQGDGITFAEGVEAHVPFGMWINTVFYPPGV